MSRRNNGTAGGALSAIRRLRESREFETTSPTDQAQQILSDISEISYEIKNITSEIEKDLENNQRIVADAESANARAEAAEVTALEAAQEESEETFRVLKIAYAYNSSLVELIEKYKQQLSTLEPTTQKLELATEELESTIQQTLARKISEIKTSLDTIKAELAEARANTKEAEAVAVAARAEADQAKNAADKITASQIQAANARATAAQAEIKSLHAAAKAEIERLSTQIAALAEANQLHTKNKHLLAELDEAGLAVAESELVTLSARSEAKVTTVDAGSQTDSLTPTPPSTRLTPTYARPAVPDALQRIREITRLSFQRTAEALDLTHEELKASIERKRDQDNGGRE